MVASSERHESYEYTPFYIFAFSLTSLEELTAMTSMSIAA